MHLRRLGEHRIQPGAQQRVRPGVVESRPRDGERYHRDDIEPDIVSPPFAEKTEQKQEQTKIQHAGRAHEDPDSLGGTKGEQETGALLDAKQHEERQGRELRQREIRYRGLVHAEVQRDEPLEAVGQEEGSGGGCHRAPAHSPRRNPRSTRLLNASQKSAVPRSR